jgi:hypothetical protein
MEGYYAKEKNLATGQNPSTGSDIHKESRHATAMSLGKLVVPSVVY